MDSHIFPESLYRSVYSEDAHKFVVMSTDSERRNELEQKGLREPLMCFECDNGIIGDYDDYIAKWLHEDSGCMTQRCGMTIRMTGVDYAQFRLFQLSLLWRFHAAQGHSFRNVDLGADAEGVRRMLAAGDPGSQFQFPCVLVCQPDIFESLAGGITCPIAMSHGEFALCRATAAGLVWIWILSWDASRHDLAPAAVSPEGEMHIVVGNNRLSYLLKRELVEIQAAAMAKPNAHKLPKWGFGDPET